MELFLIGKSQNYETINFQEPFSSEKVEIKTGRSIHFFLFTVLKELEVLIQSYFVIENNIRSEEVFPPFYMNCKHSITMYRKNSHPSVVLFQRISYTITKNA